MINRFSAVVSCFPFTFVMIHYESKTPVSDLLKINKKYGKNEKTVGRANAP